MQRPSRFPHTLRNGRLEAKIFAVGGPLCICTLAGDAHKWDESTPHEFRPFPLPSHRSTEHANLID